MGGIFARKALLAGGWADNVRLEIEAGRISAIAADAAATADDQAFGIAIPGFANAHSHAFQRVLAGHTEGYRSGGLYVVGFDHRSGEIRTFAVERILNLELTDESFNVPASFDFDSWSASSFGVIAEPATRVVLRFEQRWASYVEEHTWHPTQELRAHKNGRLELTMEVGDTADLRAWILSFGAGAEVIEPPELRDAVQRELENAIARYAEKPPKRRKSASTSPRRRRAAARG